MVVIIVMRVKPASLPNNWWPAVMRARAIIVGAAAVITIHTCWPRPVHRNAVVEVWPRAVVVAPVVIPVAVVVAIETIVIAITIAVVAVAVVTRIVCTYIVWPCCRRRRRYLRALPLLETRICSSWIISGSLHRWPVCCGALHYLRRPFAVGAINTHARAAGRTRACHRALWPLLPHFCRPAAGLALWLTLSSLTTTVSLRKRSSAAG